MIENKPSIYNAQSVYNQGGGDVIGPVIGGIKYPVTLISRFSSDTTTAMGISLFILAVPSVLISNENIFSCIYLISGELVL